MFESEHHNFSLHAASRTDLIQVFMGCSLCLAYFPPLACLTKPLFKTHFKYGILFQSLPPAPLTLDPSLRSHRPWHVSPVQHWHTLCCKKSCMCLFSPLDGARKSGALSKQCSHGCTCTLTEEELSNERSGASPVKWAQTLKYLIKEVKREGEKRKRCA